MGVLTSKIRFGCFFMFKAGERGASLLIFNCQWTWHHFFFNHWATQDHGEHTSASHTLLSTTLRYTISTPEGRRLFIVPSLPTLVQHRPSRYDEVRLQLSCHLVFLPVSLMETRCVHNKNNNKGDKRSNSFFMCDHKGRVCFPPLSCGELVLRLLLRPHQHDKDNWKNAALFYKG